MHDIHRDSLLTGKEKQQHHHASAAHQHDLHHEHSSSDDHYHAYQEHSTHEHHHHDEHSPYQDWHGSPHHDGHHHTYKHRMNRERVYSHQHQHRHVYYHAHHHSHDTRLQTLFTEGRRDWFALSFMAVLIGVALFARLPQGLDSGLLVSAALIGIFPAAKNALFACIYGRKPSVELFIVLGLLSLLFAGYFVVAAFSALFVLAGSFVHLDFSWRR